MPRDEVQAAMVNIEKQLMRLSNQAQGNADYFDAILSAQLALHEAVYGESGE